MTRFAFCLAAGVSSLLLVPAAARAQRRCPFTSQMQVQVQIQWQRQQMIQNQFRTQPRQMTRHVPQQRIQRNTTTMVRRNNTPVVRRQTVTRQRTNTQLTQRRTPFTVTRPRTQTQVRRTTTITRVVPRTTTVRRSNSSICRTPRTPSAVRPRVRITTQRTLTRNTTHTTRQLQRITTQRRQTQARRTLTTTTRRNTPTLTRRTTTSQKRSVTTTPRRQTTPTVTRTTRKVETHKPTVRLRITMQNKCGSCHNCSQKQPPSITRIPPRMPFLGDRPRQPVLDRVVRQVVRPQPNVPRVTPRPRPQPAPPRFVVRQPGPQPVPPGFVVPSRPTLPITRPPVLPPLTVARAGVPQKPSLESLLGGTPSRSMQEPPGAWEDAPVRPRPATREKQAPPLPSLKGGIAQLSPLLAEVPAEDEDRSRPAVRPRLDPSAVTQAPRLPPLSGTAKGVEVRLLPGLDGDPSGEEDGDGTARPALVELTRRPPPLPPLPGAE